MKTLKNLLTLSIFTALIAGCGRTPEGEYRGKPKETITLERAREMFQAYQPRFNAVTEFRQGKEDARYGWHSIEFFKDYIAYLERESKKVKIPVSGLRLYYVAYPNDEASGEHRDYQSYIFVPTYFDKKTNSHIAFDPLHIDSNGNPLPIHDMITKGARGKDGVSMLLVSSPPPAQTQSSIANMAQMCEPNCPEK
jgi:hypothetical protein